MLKHGLLAAGMVLAASAPALAQMPPAPMPPATTASAVVNTDPATGEVYATWPAGTQPPPALRVEGPVPSNARGVWVAPHYNWDGSTYIRVAGQYMQPPYPGAHWIDGHWNTAPYAYFWVSGHFQ